MPSAQSTDHSDPLALTIEVTINTGTADAPCTSNDGCASTCPSSCASRNY
jgi:hypothetical protein